MTNINIRENVQLAPYTTMKIGGRARFFVRADDEDDVVSAVQFARSQNLPLFVLGGGSNVLIADNGFDGLVIKIGLSGFVFHVPSSESVLDPNSKLVTAGAGEDWDKFVAFCVDSDLAGVECLSGIPGLVGGTPVQNVGAYGQEVSETIVSVCCLEIETLRFVTMTNSECGFSYRKSIFNSTDIGRYIVLGVTFSLKENGEPKIVYKDIREYFGERKPSLSEVRETVLSIRRAKSMVINADDPNSRSAGSFFKNPIVSRETFASIRAEFDSVPSFSVDQENVKIPAAWLIENAGFGKGYALGRAGISSKHTLAIINRGGANAADILALKDEIQAAVKSKFDITLTPEPIFIGF